MSNKPLDTQHTHCPFCGGPYVFSGSPIVPQTEFATEVKGRWRVPLRERLRVWLQNLSVFHVGLSVRTLSRALQKDPGFARSWHANIAMTIYDNLGPARPPSREELGIVAQAWCTPSNAHKVMDTELALAFQDILARKLADCTLSIHDCNRIADRMMRHLFGVTPPTTPPPTQVASTLGVSSHPPGTPRQAHPSHCGCSARSELDPASCPTAPAAQSKPPAPEHPLSSSTAVPERP